MEDCSALLAS